MEISDRGEEIDVVRLFCRSMIFAGDKLNSIDCHFAVHEPSELAFVAKTPESCEYVYK